MTTATRSLSKNIISRFCNKFCDSSKSLGLESVSPHSKNKIGGNGVDI